jgi:hypothetical protein
MTAFRSSRTTFATTGAISIALLPFTPVGLEVFVAPNGASDSQCHISHGAADGTLQNCLTTFGGGSRGYNDRIISHWENISGTWTEVLRVEFVSFTANTANFNVVTANVNYQAYMRFIG